jgi:hypothetical protein
VGFLQSSAKGSGKGSGKVSMEGSGEGPVKSSRADGPFEGVRHYDGMCGNSNMAMPEDMVRGLFGLCARFQLIGAGKQPQKTPNPCLFMAFLPRLVLEKGGGGVSGR